MNTKHVRLGLAISGGISIFLSQLAGAQTATSAQLKSSAGGDLESLIADAKDARKQADVLNQALTRFNSSTLAPEWLKALNLQFKTFQPTSSGKNATLGVEYSYDKAVTEAPVFGGEYPGYLSFSIKARGNVSFDKDNNPADFLQSGIQFHLWQLLGQKEKDPATAADFAVVNKAAAEFAALDKPWSEIKGTPEGRKFLQDFFANDPLNFFYDAAGNVSLESNQTFSKKQWAYGLEAHAILRVWDPNSAGSKFNIFDWPFALTRMLGGEQFQPCGRFLPSVMAGIDLIDPVGNADRFKIDPDKGAYPRFKAEIGFRSKVVEIEGKPIWFNAGYRYFQELGASSAIQAANMDTQHYFTASLDLLWNVSVTYSAGKLPFDLKNQQVWALGYNVRF